MSLRLAPRMMTWISFICLLWAISFTWFMCTHKARIMTQSFLNISPACCIDNQWACEQGHICIQNEDVCDGGFDCSDDDHDDKSDEYDSLCRAWNCSQNMLKCADEKQCIFTSDLCNGDVDCLDKSDEQDCKTYTCPSGNRNSKALKNQGWKNHKDSSPLFVMSTSLLLNELCLWSFGWETAIGW